MTAQAPKALQIARIAWSDHAHQEEERACDDTRFTISQAAPFTVVTLLAKLAPLV